LLIVLGIVGLIQVSRGKANLGIDFVGGTTVQLSFKERVPIDKARAALEKNGFQSATIQELGEGNKILIRLRESEGTSDKVQTMFKQEFTNNPFEIDSIMEIGPVIGKALQRDALVAITVSIIAIIFYIALRFEVNVARLRANGAPYDLVEDEDRSLLELIVHGKRLPEALDERAVERVNRLLPRNTGLIVYSQYMNRTLMNNYPPPAQFATKWEEVIKILQERHKGDSVRVAVYPYGGMQHQEIELDG
jgi:preprotein translocase subunit SecD